MKPETFFLFFFNFMPSQPGQLCQEEKFQKKKAVLNETYFSEHI